MTDPCAEDTVKEDNSPLNTPTQKPQQRQEEDQGKKEEELHRLLVPDACDLPLSPPSAVESNFVFYFAPGYLIIRAKIFYCY